MDIRGTQGFQLRLGLAPSMAPGPWNYFLPGETVDLDAHFYGSDGGGRVTVGGRSFRVPMTEADVFFRAVAGSEVVPALDGTFTASSRFELGRDSYVQIYDEGPEGPPTIRFPLIGRGHATVELRPDRFEPYWAFARARYDFEPVPEPATLLLLGTGIIAGLATRRCG